MAPTVSIITTIYNRAAYLEAAVRSVRTQTFTDFEHILYDDGSTDDSLDLALRLAREDPRVRLVEGPHMGVVRALKAAHDHARAPLIGWLDSDDLLVTSALRDTKAALDDDPGADLVFTDHVLIDERSRIIPEPPRAAKPFAPEHLLTELTSFAFRLFRRSLFEACGGIDDSYTAAPDYDFCLRASEVCRFVHLPKPLYCYRRHPGAISAARRAEQVENSRRAVEQALVRRGLADRFALHVDARGMFSLKPIGKPRPDAGRDAVSTA